MTTITITIKGKSVAVSRDVAERQIATAQAAIDAMTPVGEQAANRYATAAEVAKAQAAQDARRAMLTATIAACRAALEA